jgi:hypothetical protein
MAGMRKPLPVAWAVFDGIDRMHVAKEYSEAESCAEDIGGEIVPLYRSPRWITVGERLPEKHTAVLVHTDMDGNHAASFDGEEWFCDYGGAWLFPNVTHWMPLPEPPEVK